MSAKHLVLTIVINLISIQIFANNPAYSKDEQVYLKAVKDTQEKISPLLYSFVEQATPTIAAIDTYVSTFESICNEERELTKQDIDKLIASLKSVESELKKYQESNAKGSQNYISRRDLMGMISSNQSFSLEELYKNRRSYIKFSMESEQALEMADQKLLSNTNEVTALYRALDTVFAKIFYANTFNKLRQDLLVKISSMLKPSEMKCNFFSHRFFAEAKENVIPRWNIIIKGNVSPAIVGDVENATSEDNIGLNENSDK